MINNIKQLDPDFGLVLIGRDITIAAIAHHQKYHPNQRLTDHFIEGAIKHRLFHYGMKGLLSWPETFTPEERNAANKHLR